MSLSSDESARAFLLVIGAGAATGLGAAIVFAPSSFLSKLGCTAFSSSLPQHYRRRANATLAVSLGFSAGVMLYVSIRDIYTKSMDGFQANGHDEHLSFHFATYSFFAGILLMKIMDELIKRCLVDYSPEMEMNMFGNTVPDNFTCQPTITACNDDKPSSSMIEEEEEEEDNNNSVYCDDSNDGHEDKYTTSTADVEAPSNNNNTITPATPTPTRLQSEDNGLDKKHLFVLGIKTAAAICLHNFPEGLATFVAYTADTSVGITLAIGIALHNIPEGLCVALPVYYASGSAWKGFAWGTLSGLSEPIGGLLAWIVLQGSVSGNTYGILFGLVGGIMVFISVDELLPAAYKHDSSGKLVSVSVFLGMLLMAVSLILFQC